MGRPNEPNYPEERRKWAQRMSKPNGQALIRHLSRDEIRDRIPATISDVVTVEDYEDILLVKVVDKPEAVVWLQSVCDQDCERMLAAQREEFPEEFAKLFPDLA